MSEEMRDALKAEHVDIVDKAWEWGDEKKIAEVYEIVDKLPYVEAQTVLQLFTEYKNNNPAAWLKWNAQHYIEEPTPFNEWIKNPDFTGKVGQDFWPVWQEEIATVCEPKNGIVEWYVCVTGDTPVALCDGSTPTIKDLSDENRTDFWIWTYSKEKKKVIPTKAKHPHKTGVKRVYKVTLDNGTWFKATADHPMLRRDGELVEVQDMIPGMSLMPLRRRVYEGKALPGYTQVYQPEEGKWEFEHRLVADEVFGERTVRREDGVGKVVHHRDFTKTNNDPGNLEYQWADDHHRVHAKTASETHKKHPHIVKRMREGQLHWVNSPEGKRASSERIKKYNKENPKRLTQQAAHALKERWKSPEQRRRASDKMRKANASLGLNKRAGEAFLKKHPHKAPPDKITALFDDGVTTITEMAERLECGTTSILRAVKRMGYAKWSDFKKDRTKNYNHKVVSVEDCGEEDVYCLHVPETGLWGLILRDAEGQIVPHDGLVSKNTGCIGGGKTYSTLVAQLYKGPYICSCLKNPQKYFGIADGSEIVFGLFNAILTNAVEVDFNQMARFVKESPWFRDHCPAVCKRGLIHWPSREMTMRIGSSEMHALGANLFSYLIDEVNFMKTPMSKEAHDHQAYKIYHHASRRLKSRFQKHGICPGLACIVSSRLATTSFLETLMEDNKDDPQSYVSDFAMWESKGRDNFAPGEFRVACGSKYRKSEVLDVVDTRGKTNTFDWITKPGGKSVPEGMKCVRVPNDFWFDFNRDMDGSLRDIAGLATHGLSSLIYRTEAVLECVDSRREHPFMKESHELSLFDDNAALVNFMQWRKLCKITDGNWIPYAFPDQPRFCHIDLGLTGDCAAIAVGCAYSQFIQHARDVETGQPTETFMPKVYVDFMLQIKPTRGEQIDLQKIVDFVLNLRNYGYWVQRVTFDGFASEMAIQAILKANLVPPRHMQQKKSADEVVKIESYVISVDKDDKPYRMLRDMIQSNAINYYHYQPFIDEVLELEHDVTQTVGGNIKGKVDHPEGGCFVGDTRIPLLDGTMPTIAELAGRGDVWVYSSDEHGRIVPGRARARMTKKTGHLVDVVLDSGAVVRCTPDHLFRLRNGTYKSAASLVPAVDRLMPINRLWPVNGGYERVNWKEFQATEVGKNHKVRAVIPVMTAPVEVYDLEVDKWSNFALSCGVFVHNSKDVSDAVCGMSWGIATAKTPHGSEPSEGIIGDYRDKDSAKPIDEQLNADIVADYADPERIKAIINPTPTAPPPARPGKKKILTRSDWQKTLSADGFGRHRP